MKRISQFTEELISGKEVAKDQVNSNSLSTAATSIQASSTKKPDIASNVDKSILSSDSVITLGSPGHEWRYHPDSKTYDLSRDTPHGKYNFKTTEGPKGVSVKLAIEKTALVIIDMQNYFLHPKVSSHPAGLESAAKIKKVLQRAREVGIQVIWLNWGLTEEDINTMPASVLNSFAGNFITPPSTTSKPLITLGSDMGSNMGRMLMRDSWNAAIYDELSPFYDKDRDIECFKNRVSGLWCDESPFGMLLKEKGVQSVLFTGVNTNQCVLGTLMDCYFRGFDCVLIDDCCGTTTPGGQDVVVTDSAGLYGFVTDSDAFVDGQRE